MACAVAASCAPSPANVATQTDILPSDRHAIGNFLEDARCAFAAPDKTEESDSSLHEGWYLLTALVTQFPELAEEARLWREVDETADKICYWQATDWSGSTPDLVASHVTKLNASAKRLFARP